MKDVHIHIPDELADRLAKIAESLGETRANVVREATAQYIIRHIKPLNLRITRIARGIPVGGNLEYADSQTIKRAMEGRMEY